MLIDGGAIACWPGEAPSCVNAGNCSEPCMAYDMLGWFGYPVLSNMAWLDWLMSGIC